MFQNLSRTIFSEQKKITGMKNKKFLELFRKKSMWIYVFFVWKLTYQKNNLLFRDARCSMQLVSQSPNQLRFIHICLGCSTVSQIGANFRPALYHALLGDAWKRVSACPKRGRRVLGSVYNWVTAKGGHGGIVRWITHRNVKRMKT